MRRKTLGNIAPVYSAYVDGHGASKMIGLRWKKAAVVGNLPT